MLEINQRLSDKFLAVVKTYEVASKSEPGVVHKVEQLPGGKLVCDCAAGCFGSPCRHKRIVFNEINGITKSEYETL